MHAVDAIKEHIVAGDIFQAVLSRRMECAVGSDPFPVYETLREINPSPYMERKGRFGKYGGQFVPETLMNALIELEGAYNEAAHDKKFAQELAAYQSEYAGRPTPLTFCENMSRDLGLKVYLKREDLVHGGSHKLNNTLGQALLAKRMGKKRLIAETGAGQHGVATAIAGAALGFKVEVFMCLIVRVIVRVHKGSCLKSIRYFVNR